LISYGVPPLGGVKQGTCGEKQAIFELFSTLISSIVSYRIVYLENGERYVQSYC